MSIHNSQLSHDDIESGPKERSDSTQDSHKGSEKDRQKQEPQLYKAFDDFEQVYADRVDALAVQIRERLSGPSNEDERQQPPIDDAFESLLYRYANSLRDFEYMTSKPLVLKKTLNPDRACGGLRFVNISREYSTVYERWAVDIFDYGFNSLQDFLQKLGRSVLVGCCLLVPMIIMTYFTSRAAVLGVTSGSVLLVGLAIAATASKFETIIGATAAYAAVLVVFVGNALTIGAQQTSSLGPIGNSTALR